MPYNPYYAYKSVKEHLYNSRNWSDAQIKAFNLMYGFTIPGIGIQPWKGTIDFIYDSRAGDKYRDRYGITGGGYDPRKAPDANIGASLSSTLNYVSKNVERLYEDDKPHKRRKGRELDDYVKSQMRRYGY